MLREKLYLFKAVSFKAYATLLVNLLLNDKLFYQISRLIIYLFPDACSSINPINICRQFMYPSIQRRWIFVHCHNDDTLSKKTQGLKYFFSCQQVLNTLVNAIWLSLFPCVKFQFYTNYFIFNFFLLVIKKIFAFQKK